MKNDSNSSNLSKICSSSISNEEGIKLLNEKKYFYGDFIAFRPPFNSSNNIKKSKKVFNVDY